MPNTDSPNFEKAFALQEESGSLHPYVSKSRLVSYHKNPYHFYLGYVLGFKEPQNYYMWRGSEVHSVFEEYYLNVLAAVEAGEEPGEPLDYLPADVTMWADWVEPYVSNFMVFERRRLEHCRARGVLEAFPPVAVEREVWWWDAPGIPWMGYADVVLDARSLPEFDCEGLIVMDHKTGKTPDTKYRGDGIYLELEYYNILFRETRAFGDNEVVGVAGYYPMKNDLVTTAPRSDREAKVFRIIEELLSKGDDADDYPREEMPLCKWGPDKDSQSYYYGNICPCKWGRVDGPGPDYVDENYNPV
jgi:hypothetical protein